MAVSIVKTRSKEPHIGLMTYHYKRKTDFLKDILKKSISRQLLLNKVGNIETFSENKVETEKFYLYLKCMIF